MKYEEAQAALARMLQESREGPYYTLEEVDAHIREMFKPENLVYITGDPHGNFRFIEDFIERTTPIEGSTFIILGDVGLNYYGDKRDLRGKNLLGALPYTFFCLHGNHENRPQNIPTYHETEYRGGKCMVEDAYPNLLFPVDGEVFDFCGHSCLVIGGAYSVDKFYRLSLGYNWFPDEQPSPEIKKRVEEALSKRDWKIDIVLSHTCPLRYEPVEVFLDGIDPSTVDKSTETWLGGIESQLDYERWYCGHYHTDKKIDKLEFLFHSFTMLPREHLNIEEERAWVGKMEAKFAFEAEMMEALERGPETESQ